MPVSGAVHSYQTDAPPGPPWSCSSNWKEAPKLSPLVLPELPEMTMRAAKSSLTTWAWLRDAIAQRTHHPRKIHLPWAEDIHSLKVRFFNIVSLTFRDRG